MLETQPLDGIGEFDVNAEIVGIQFELVAFEQRALFIDVEKERRDIAVDLELPVPVAGRIGLEIDPRSTVGQRTLGAWASAITAFPKRQRFLNVYYSSQAPWALYAL